MEPQLLGARRLRELLDAHGATPRKALGQNFVIDPNTIRKVVEVAGVRGEDAVLEIGAGAGSLSLGLAATAGRVVAVEFDRALIPVLRAAVGGLDAVEIFEADALTLDYGAIEATKLVANLPYNIATPLVLKVLEEAPSIRTLAVMTQKEAGQRLAAVPGSKAYGAPSVLVAYSATARVAARVSRRAFYPVPNVDSVIVRLDRRAAEPPVPREPFARIVRAAFAQRRKTLRNNLTPVAGSATKAEAWIIKAGLDPGARAETVDLDGFVALAESLQ